MECISHYRQLFLDDTPLLDVRAPVEFAGGAFPTSDNLPLLDDDQRHRIGICYKQHGQQAAIALGHELVGGALRDARIAGWQRWLAQHRQGVLYCFRGGLRSQTVQQWLHDAGTDVPLVSGGYKAMRRFLLNTMERIGNDAPMRILCGRTGCGKTRLIEQHDKALDLEGAAHHRGSAFGGRPGGQPAQIDFENRLAVALLKLDAAQADNILIEDEGRLVGRCHVPLVLQQRIANSSRILIDEDLPSRVKVTLEDYVIGPLTEYRQHFGAEAAMARLGEQLLAGVDKIKKRLGSTRHAELRTLLSNALVAQQQGDPSQHEHWLTPLLRDYYDPMYDYMLAKRSGPIVFQGSRQQVSDWLAEQGNASINAQI